MDSLKYFIFPSNETEWVSFISLSIGILSVLLAVLFYFKSKRTKLLLFAQRSFRVVTDRFSNIPGLEVTMFRKPVNNITVTRLALWNGGNQTIDAQDVPKLEPIVILPLGEGNTYNASILETTGGANEIKLDNLSPKRKGWLLTFEFLDPGDGVVLNIVHDGKERDLFGVTGKVKGGRIRRGLRTREEDRNPVPVGPGGAAYEIPLTSSGLRFLGYLAILFGFVFLVIALYADRDKLSFLFPLIFVSAGIIILFVARFFYPRFKLTKFDDF